MLLERAGLFSSYCLRNEGFLRKAGWFESFHRRESVGAHGCPIPWITYPCLAFLEPRVGRDMVVFEYGMGNSTLWWAERVARVVSCEHDKEWHDRIAPRCPSNVTVHRIELSEGGPYANKVAERPNEYDIVVIDGRDRINCAKNCVGALKKDGVVLWDNSDLTEYQEGYAVLGQRGFRRVDFWGMGPIGVDAWCTSIFYRSENCLKI
jgi:hypothetical protein